MRSAGRLNQFQQIKIKYVCAHIQVHTRHRERYHESERLAGSYISLPGFIPLMVLSFTVNSGIPESSVLLGLWKFISVICEVRRPKDASRTACFRMLINIREIRTAMRELHGPCMIFDVPSLT